MAQRLRRYFHQQRGAQLREEARQALPHLSPALQIEVIMHVHAHWMRAVWFVRDLADEASKVRCAMHVKPRVLSPGEIAPSGFCYVITRGSVVFGMRMLSRGQVHRTRAVTCTLARALTYARPISPTQLIHLARLCTPDHVPSVANPRPCAVVGRRHRLGGPSLAPAFPRARPHFH
jgi:hypothetical protein